MTPLDQLFKGSTRILILTLLQDKPMYGYQLVRELSERSDGYFNMKEGLLYPTLHQMAAEGLLSSEWKTINNRRRKYYQITAEGSARLAETAQHWRMFARRLLELIGGTP